MIVSTPGVALAQRIAERSDPGTESSVVVTRKEQSSAPVSGTLVPSGAKAPSPISSAMETGSLLPGGGAAGRRLAERTEARLRNAAPMRTHPINGGLKCLIKVASCLRAPE